MKTMRRKDRAMAPAQALALLTNAEYGVLSTVGNDGQPYGVPLNFVYKDSGVYFHCAEVGHKLDNIKANPRVSFCVVGPTNVLPSEFATQYESAMVFGSAAPVIGDEKEQALLWLLEKYSPDFLEQGRQYIRKHGQATTIIKITITGVSGKARR